MSITSLSRNRLGQSYAPTMTLTDNLAASSATNLMISISGSLVEVSGFINVDPTSGASYTLDIPLPFGQAVVATTDVAGIAHSDTALDVATSLVDGDATLNTATVLRAASTATAAHEIYVRFAYLQE